MIDIRVEGLVKSFDLEKKILDGLTFQVDTGERVGLLGRNGAGKTTLFKILTGELDYDEGTVVVGQGRRAAAWGLSPRSLSIPRATRWRMCCAPPLPACFA